MRMMAVFEKGETLRYIGHLDLMRTVQRALRRSGLPVKYSNGFNPHIRLSFAAPLSVGVVGRRELMEVPVEDGLSAEQFQTTFNAVSPACLQVVYARCVSDEFPTLMSLVAGSRYTIRLYRSEEADRAAAAFEDFMALESYVANRRTKSGENPCDIRPFVKEGSIRKTDEGYEISLETVTFASGALKPSLWLECLCAFAGCEKPHHIIYRDAILALGAGEQLIPMEEYPHA
ncbi:MAG: DUF2344 domain-containing protein [Clostridiales bacterium]|nr:DUF2344 domain-containing protein [Clostridiales bacterium]